MAMSYVEEIAKAYFEYIGGYIVSKDMPYQDKNSLKKVKGLKDIDILAIKGDSAIIGNCIAFAGTQKSELVVEKIYDDFKTADEFLKEKFPHIKKIAWWFIIDLCPPKTLNGLGKKGIRITKVRDLIDELIKNINKDLALNRRMGKTQNMLIRTLQLLCDSLYFDDRYFYKGEYKLLINLVNSGKKITEIRKIFRRDYPYIFSSRLTQWHDDIKEFK